MVKVLLDVLWTLCFFLSGDVVAAAASEDDAVFAPTWARSRSVPKPNLQPDFNVSVFECFDASSSAVLRELDESDRSV